MARTFVVLYGGALKNGMLNRDTKDRCDAAIKAASRYPDAPIVFCVDHTIPDLRKTTIEYLLFEKKWPAERLMLNARGHNSLGETLGAIQVLRELEGEKVIIVSSWYHLPRLALMWLLNFDGAIWFKASWVATNLTHSLAWEVAAFGKYFLRLNH